MSKISDFYGYEPVPIDIDRGIVIRMLGAKRIMMYKDMPGLFLDARGGEVDGEIAQQAGFDVAALRREAKVKAEIHEATARILAAQRQAEAEIRGRLDADVAEAMPTNAITGELADQLVDGRTKEGKPRSTRNFEMVHMGAGLWQVQRRDAGRGVVSGRLQETAAIQAMLEAQIDLETEPGGPEED
jgi:hypothetical protein